MLYLLALFYSTQFLIPLVVAASAAFSLADGKPLHTLDVVDPQIVEPVANQTWVIGTNQTIAWNTTDLPGSAPNATGIILLGNLFNDSEHLQIKHPLATGFLLSDGNITITVPDVTPRDDYIIALLGDSGNISPTFSISSANGSDPVTTVDDSTLIANSTQESSAASNYKLWGLITATIAPCAAVLLLLS